MKHASSDYFYTFVTLFTILRFSYLFTFKGCKFRECICLVQHHTCSALNTETSEALNKQMWAMRGLCLSIQKCWRRSWFEKERRRGSRIHSWKWRRGYVRPHIHNYYLAASGSGCRPRRTAHSSHKGRLIARQRTAELDDLESGCWNKRKGFIQF